MNVRKNGTVVFLVIIALFSCVKASNVHYVVALENSTSYSQRTWGLHVNETSTSSAQNAQPTIVLSTNGVSIDHSKMGSFRRCLENNTPSANTINPSSAKPSVNPTELLTGSSSFFSLCPVPNNIPYIEFLPNLTVTALESFTSADSDITAWYNVIDYCSLFNAITNSSLSQLSQNLYSSISYVPYYPEGYFNITLKLSLQNTAIVGQAASVYPNYAVNPL